MNRLRLVGQMIADAWCLAVEVMLAFPVAVLTRHVRL